MSQGTNFLTQMWQWLQQVWTSGQGSPVFFYMFLISPVLILFGCLLLVRKRSGWVYLMLISAAVNVTVGIAQTVMWHRIMSGGSHDDYIRWVGLFQLGHLAGGIGFGVSFIGMAIQDRIVWKRGWVGPDGPGV